jgi:hypothetical protein
MPCVLDPDLRFRLTLPSLIDSVNQGHDHLPCREALSRAALNQSQRYHTATVAPSSEASSRSM